ncbi:MAG: 16S rRNA (guanine(527)-N(7))-methyltransferase RsmG [Spirochaetes bacterium]|nr:16S rRNA (guanine(527)-N(7))-methyltransferase RsmG [Spirochaetota bacterium]
MNDTLKEGVLALRRGDSDIDRLAAGRDDFIPLLEAYISQIELFNPAYGLVGTSDRRELVVKHILDSLAPLGIIYRLLIGGSGAGRRQVADVGSGAGLPGVPLAIALPGCEFTLVERMGRRAGFLWNTKAALGLSNVSIEEKEVEKTALRFDLVTFRAFQPLEPKLLKALFRICSPGGCLAAYKGKAQKITEEMQPLEKLCASWQATPCPVPFLDEERHLVTILPGV